MPIFRKIARATTADSIVYENGHYHVIGKKNVSVFVNEVKAIITDCAATFNDPESIGERTTDLKVLADMLKIKAS